MDELFKPVVELAKAAGEAILYYYGKQKQELAVRQKVDETPLTAADLAAHEVIVAGLQKLTPDLPILSEEGDLAPFAVRQQWTRYWLVDPLDGTRGFVEGSAEFTVNIALIEQGRPMLAAIYAPVSKVCYYAAAAMGAFKEVRNDQPIALRTTPWQWDNYRLVMGKYLGKTGLLRLFDKAPGCHIQRLNSSLKFGCVAEGAADIYPRFGTTGEWDTAAGQCILEEAGGCVVTLANEPLRYNSKASVINPEFIALGDPSAAEKVIQFIVDKRRSL